MEDHNSGVMKDTNMKLSGYLLNDIIFHFYLWPWPWPEVKVTFSQKLKYEKCENFDAFNENSSFYFTFQNILMFAFTSVNFIDVGQIIRILLRVKI